MSFHLLIFIENGAVVVFGGVFLKTSEAGKPSHKPKHGQVRKISTCLGLCTALPPTDSQSQGLSEDNTDLET